MGQRVETVLFACVHDADRSQIAAAWFNLLADPSKARAVPAGSESATHVQPEVRVAMKEVGLDLAAARSRPLSDELVGSASLIVTMGGGDVGPITPGVERDDWPVEEPKSKTLEEVRRIRDEVQAWVVALLRERGWEH
jgi:arsenate reductase